MKNDRYSIRLVKLLNFFQLLCIFPQLLTNIMNRFRFEMFSEMINDWLTSVCPIEFWELRFNGCPSYLEIFERLEHLKSFKMTNYTQEKKLIVSCIIFFLDCVSINSFVFPGTEPISFLIFKALQCASSIIPTGSTIY